MPSVMCPSSPDNLRRNYENTCNFRSARRGSFNTKLVRTIVDIRPQDQVFVRNDLERLPFFNANLESEEDPSVVADLRADMELCDLLVFATPEHNGRDCPRFG